MDSSTVTAMRLETERLTIRPYVESDLMECFRLSQDEALYTYLPMAPQPLEEYRGFFQWLMDCYATGFDGDFKYSFNVVLRESGAHIGWVGIGGLDYDPSRTEIFWAIAKEHWNNGYASEAAAALLRYGFEVIGVEEVVALCKPENVGSRRVMEKVGLTFRGVIEGVPAEHDFYGGEVLYALTAAEYRTSRKAESVIA